MTRPNGPIMYPVGWKGVIGPFIVVIEELKLTSRRLKRGRIISRAPKCETSAK